jgi:hypothetical protein
MPAFRRFVRNMTGLEPAAANVDPDLVRSRGRPACSQGGRSSAEPRHDACAASSSHVRARAPASLAELGDWLEA